MRILRTLEKHARLPLLAAVTLLLATSGAGADKAGDALVQQVMARVDAMQPAGCDYTVTYQLGDARRTFKGHAYTTDAGNGRSSKGMRSEGNVKLYLNDVLFGTLEFMPRLGNPPQPPTASSNVTARYVGKETFEGVEYQVVEVTTPYHSFTSPPPNHRIVLRWYVGVDDLIHRITTRLPFTDALYLSGPAAQFLDRPLLPDRPRAGNRLGEGKSSAKGSGKPPAAPDTMILVEAISAGAHRAVMPAVRPPTNPPLPARLRLEAGAGRGPILLSPDGRLLAIVNDDSSISLYDPNTGMKTLDLTGHTAPVPHVSLTHLQFAAGSRLLVSADSVDTIRVWDTATGLLKQEIKTPGDILSGICVSPDGGLLGGFNNVLGMLYLWNRNTGAALPPLPIGSAQTVAFSPDATRFVTVGSVEMALWDVTSGKARLRVPYVGGPFGVLPAAWSPDGKQYVWMRSDGGLVVCEGQNGAQTRELKGAAGALAALAFAADGKTLLGVDADQRGDIPTGKPGLVIWNTADWTVQEARELAGARTSGFQNPPILAPAGRRLLLIDNEGLQFWDLAETLPPLNTKP